MDRRTFIMSALSAAFVPYAHPSRAEEGTRAILEAELASGRPCASEATAIRNTLTRMSRLTPPRTGKSIIVDMPSQQLSCYEDSSVVLSSRVVVGEKDWKTPDLDTTAAFVRFNPTWTVPQSILKSRNWRGRLAEDPNYFEDLNFDVELDGQLMPPRQAYHRAGEVGRFVQKPGRGNALGLVKIGLNAGDAIYLHDTNDPSKFSSDLRAASHGCIRVEEALPVAAWVLGISPEEASMRVDSEDKTDYRSMPKVRVVTTYFTAWPDEFGEVRYYPDIYNRDGNNSRYCSESASYQSPSSGRSDAFPEEIIVTGN